MNGPMHEQSLEDKHALLEAVARYLGRPISDGLTNLCRKSALIHKASFPLGSASEWRWLHIYAGKVGILPEFLRPIRFVVPRKKQRGRRFKQRKRDSFYSSAQWKTLRMKALVLYGAKCACCGVTPSDGAKMNVDHIKPRRDFPHLELQLSNLQVLCGACNQGKGNWDQTDWRG